MNTHRTFEFARSIGLLMIVSSVVACRAKRVITEDDCRRARAKFSALIDNEKKCSTVDPMKAAVLDDASVICGKLADAKAEYKDGESDCLTKASSLKELHACQAPGLTLTGGLDELGDSYLKTAAEICPASQAK